MVSRHGFLNEMQVFTTILIPHTADQKPEDLIKQVELLRPSNNAQGVVIRSGGKSFYVGAKTDLTHGVTRYWRRPQYTWDTGKVTYGKFETDADHFFAIEQKDRLYYAISNSTGIHYKDKALFKQAETTFRYGIDGKPNRPGISKIRLKEGELNK